MSSIVIFDTSVMVEQLRSGRHQERINSVNGQIHISSVVLAELWRGATRREEREFLRALQKNHPLLPPAAGSWIESGELLCKMHVDKGLSPGKLRDLHFDVLIALTARSYGARLITSNRADFELIQQYRTFDLEIW